MATYVNDLRLTELATGEGSGTWGVTTNTNLELIGEALGYGTQDCFATDADATTTVADGATDPARAMYFKVTSSATLTATRTLTIAPNTMTRVMLIENATTGSQSIAISQGTGGNVTIASGQVRMVYLDGAGAGAAVVDALADLELGTITVANLTATTADINGGTIDGATLGGSSQVTITDADMNGGTIDGVVIGGASAAAGTFTNLTASGTVSFSGATVSDGGTVTTVNIDGGNIDGTIIGAASTAAGSFTTITASDDVNFDSGTFFVDASADAVGIGTTSPGAKLEVAGATQATGAVMRLTNAASSSSWVAGDVIGQLDFYSSDGSFPGTKAQIKAFADTGNGSTAVNYSALSFSTMLNSAFAERMRIDSSGNVGIGGTPSSRLHVKYTTGSLPNADFVGHVVERTSVTGDAIGSHIAVITGSGKGLIIGGGGDGGSFGTFDGTTSSEAMRITSAGQVGIGTTGPDRKCSVYVSPASASDDGYRLTDGTRNAVLALTGASYTYRGVPASSTMLYNNSPIAFLSDSPTGRISFHNDSGETMRIDSSGRVGIGNSSPSNYTGASSNTLVIGSNSGNNGITIVGGTAGYSSLAFADGAGAGDTTDYRGLFQYYHNTDTLNIFTAGSERARIDSSGNFMVGTTTTNVYNGTTPGVALTSTGYVFAGKAGDAPLYLNRITNDGDIVVFSREGTTVGSIGTVSEYLYIGGTAGNDAFLSLGADGVRPATSAGAARDAAIDLGGVTNRFRNAYLSGGVYLGGTGAANLLDDYEEGTWTPILSYSGGTGTGSWTYSVQEGNYTKIGRLVYFRAEVRLATFSKGTASGTPQITGLPFTSGGVINGEHYAVNYHSYNAPTPTTTGQFPAPQVGASGTLINLYVIQNNGAYGNIPDPDADSQYKIAGWYTTA